MSHTQILNVLKAIWKRPQALTLALAPIIAFSGSFLHAQSFQALYQFNCNTGGCLPGDDGQLTQGPDGNLYGTTSSGGADGDGTIFMETTSGTYTDLYQFDGSHGAQPNAVLILASDGNFYGTTHVGGTFGLGTVFRFAPPSSLTVLHNFTGGDDDQAPNTAPTPGKDGNLYGLTVSGTIYRVTLPAGTFTVLSSHAPGIGVFQDPFLLASDGNLYATSPGGGKYGKGTVFCLTAADAVKIVYSFTGGADGNTPFSPVTQGSDGYLYGTTTYGGSNGTGNVFRLTLSGTFTNLYSFDPLSGFLNNDGAVPDNGVLIGSDGFLYGANTGGGANGDGTLYLATRSGGAFEKLFDFSGNGGAVPGAEASSTLMQHTNGNLYGVTYQGGASNDGVLYSLSPASLIKIIEIEGPIFVLPGVSVEILGNDLNQVIQVNFGSVQAQFQPGSDTVLSATVPTQAVDAPVSVILDTGLEVQTQVAIHILPSITNLDPSRGAVGTQVDIVGGGFAGATKVTFGGVKATNFTVLSPALIQAVVPTGAKTGKVKVTTPNGKTTSKQKFTVG